MLSTSNSLLKFEPLGAVSSTVAKLVRSPVPILIQRVLSN